jgi:acyl-coenzyme A synthetase/AMP-(fatty) acid ligase
MSIFLRDITNNNSHTWESLINDINNVDKEFSLCSKSEYYEVFKSVIVSIISGESIVLFDIDITENERNSYIELYNIEPRTYSPNIKLNDVNDLLERIKNCSTNWSITLFTSGTTGQPKKIVHNFESITRNIKVSSNHSCDVWGLAYNPTHMAGIQVFFQALHNFNSIVRLFQLSPDTIHSEIESCKISHISATPTFYKLLLPSEHIHPTVKNITSGGEKFSNSIRDQILKMFPYAKITNVYASTEAGALFASKNDVFTLRSSFTGLVKIEQNQLMIHKSLLGVNIQENEWYKTGDLVELIDTESLSFRFISRASDLINVGGINVNPLEIEEVLQAHPGVKQSVVFCKNNSIFGNIICSQVVREDQDLTEFELRKYLQENLQEYKIPRMILFVGEITTTRSGKTKRI